MSAAQLVEVQLGLLQICIFQKLSAARVSKLFSLANPIRRDHHNCRLRSDKLSPSSLPAE
jgi:hypothetical protein